MSKDLLKAIAVGLLTYLASMALLYVACAGFANFMHWTDEYWQIANWSDVGRGAFIYFGSVLAIPAAWFVPRVLTIK